MAILNTATIVVAGIIIFVCSIIFTSRFSSNSSDINTYRHVYEMNMSINSCLKNKQIFQEAEQSVMPKRHLENQIHINMRYNFGRLLYCISLQKEINMVMDVFVNTGAGSSLLIANGLHKQKSNNYKSLIGFENDYSMWSVARDNLMHLPAFPILGSTRSLHPARPDGNMKFICDSMAIDLLVWDPSDNDSYNWDHEIETIQNICRPKFVAIHNRLMDFHKWNEKLLENLLKDGYDFFHQGWQMWPPNDRETKRHWAILYLLSPEKRLWLNKKRFGMTRVLHK